MAVAKHFLDNVIVPHSPPPTAGLYQESIIARALREMIPIRKALLHYLDDRSRFTSHVTKETLPIQVTILLKKLSDVYGACITAGRLSGMMTPWVPRLNAEVPKSDRPKPVNRVATEIRKLAVWESVNRAYDWLNRQITDFPGTVANMADKDQLTGRIIGEAADDHLIESINQALRESFQAGEGETEWRARMADIIDVRGSFDETLARTATHRSYVAGQREMLNEPVMTDLFPYRQYFATMDDRVRDTHAEMDRNVYHKDSELADHAQELLSEYNCRCSEVAMTEDDAIEIGISPGGEKAGGASLMAEIEEMISA